MEPKLAENVARVIGASCKTELSHLTSKIDFEKEVEGIKARIFKVERNIDSKISKIDTSVFTIDIKVSAATERLLAAIEKCRKDMVKCLIAIVTANVGIMIITAVLLTFFIH